MKVFVTGGSGFIGSHFLKKIPAAGHRAAALRRAGSKPRIESKPEPIWLDGNLDGDWASELSQCRMLVHFAAAGVEPRKSDWDESFNVNLRQSLQLWQQAVKSGVKRIIICGCGAEFGKAADHVQFLSTETAPEPATPHAASKVAATMAAFALAVEAKIELLVLRPFEVYGEGQAESCFWPALRKAALAGEDFAMSAGEQVRDFTPVEKVADVFIAALRRTDLRPGEPKIENVGTGNLQNFKSFAESQWILAGATGRLKIGARPYRPNEIMRFVPLIPKERPEWV